MTNVGFLTQSLSQERRQDWVSAPRLRGDSPRGNDTYLFFAQSQQPTVSDALHKCIGVITLISQNKFGFKPFNQGIRLTIL